MRIVSHAAIIAAGFAVASALASPVFADSLPLSLRSFGTSKAISAYELSATGVAGVALRPEVAAYNTSATQLATAAYGTPLTLYNPSFAFSAALTPTLALDGGSHLDVAQRFNAYDGAASPFLSAVDAPFLGLANGGRYAGMTFAPEANLRVRLGASLESERLDRFAFDPIAAESDLPLAFDPSQTRSLLAGLSWDISGQTGIDVSAISAVRSGVPQGLADSDAIAPKANTNAVGVSAHLGLGAGWVTTAAFSEGLSQLDLHGGAVRDLHEQSYSIAVAKHGLFGDDALGLSLSQPAPSMTGSFSSLIGGGSGDLPTTVIGRNPTLTTHAPETDVQLGYITNFLDGAVALQTNAGYQMNFQGKNGSNAVSLLSRAKIKF